MQNGGPGGLMVRVGRLDRFLSAAPPLFVLLWTIYDQVRRPVLCQPPFLAQRQRTLLSVPGGATEPPLLVNDAGDCCVFVKQESGTAHSPQWDSGISPLFWGPRRRVCSCLTRVTPRPSLTAPMPWMCISGHH